jgi:hypothetical protein
MKALLYKEMHLSSLVLTYCFIGFSLMTFLPGYPILCGTFFVTLGIYQSFLNSREGHDILYTVLLPIAKKDVVTGKYLFVLVIEGLSFLLMFIFTLMRMICFSHAPLYLHNALMNANFYFLAMVCIIYGMFNWLFVDGYFKTARALGKPFISYIIVTFLMIGIAEALPHMPGCAFLKCLDFTHFPKQFVLFLGGMVIFGILTKRSYRQACQRFENIDL